MTFATLIPDRNDRPELTDQCFRQLGRMTVKPDKVYHINYHPESEGYDLKTRLHRGYLQAKADGIDWVFIVENDDSYGSNYFERFLPYMDKYDFIGQARTIYYHLGARVWREQNHVHRSSLFTTAFRVSAMANFDWSGARMTFVDLDIWQFARRKGNCKFIQTGAIGIKHGIGLCGGIGHKQTTGNRDEEMLWLKERVDSDSFLFYKGLSEKLNQKVIA
jgi:hypothetical protein